jgi:hypothetical protein
MIFLCKYLLKRNSAYVWSFIDLQGQAIDQEDTVNCQQSNAITTNDNSEQEQCTPMLANLGVDNDSNIQLSSSHDTSCSDHSNMTSKSPVKGKE